MRTPQLLGLCVLGLAACSAAQDEHTVEIHANHSHVHGDDCGHQRVKHGDHVDYLHDGHLHHAHDGHVDEHVIEVTAENPDGEAPLEASLHAEHAHGEDDGDHIMIRHGDHMDFIHDGRLHYVHGEHVDDHGPITVMTNG